MKSNVGLDVLLADQPVGKWVVIDPAMSMVLSAADTPEEAIDRAHIAPSTSDRAVGERPVILQVPDPSAACFF